MAETDLLIHLGAPILVTRRKLILQGVEAINVIAQVSLLDLLTLL